jgi:FlaA1/EpsC-like NDP-sugar epimerase
MKKLFHIFLLLSFLAPGTLIHCVPTNHELFENKRIVIIGGTGYLGRGIAAEVLKYNPKKVVIFSRDEVKHYFMEKSFDNNPKIQSILGDVRDYDAVLHGTRNADIVFHVAALKRMDALECNVQEAVKTNIIGSINVFNACIENDVPKALFISTDKACLPINAYGACKFVSEKIFTNYDPSTTKTKFVATRFGNIFDSTGSVVPFFIRKIQNGEDITLTDERMTRFVITAEDASKIIFDALRYSVGGEIFVKRLTSFKVTDLIEVLKEHFNANNTVRNIGLRPGEKLHEVLINESEMGRAYLFNDYFVIRPSIVLHDNSADVPEYVKHGNRIEADHLTHFSSDQAIMSKETLKSYFEQNFIK